MKESTINTYLLDNAELANRMYGSALRITDDLRRLEGEDKTLMNKEYLESLKMSLKDTAYYINKIMEQLEEIN